MYICIYTVYLYVYIYVYIIYVYIYIYTARRLVLPGYLQGRSRHVDDNDDDD